MAIKVLMIGATELILISGIALLMFGGKKLPEMMRGLGQGVREFKKGMKEVNKPIEDDTPETTTSPRNLETEENGIKQE